VSPVIEGEGLPMAHRDLVVIGASAGGVGALQNLVRGLSPDFPAAVLVTQHVMAGGPSMLPQILARATALPCTAAREGDPLLPGRILVAVPDRHLVVSGDHVTLSSGPRENSSRPAVDVLFRSAARSRGPRVVAVVLSGAMDDGTAGLVAVRACGGIGVVQDPAEATHPSMPRSAVEGASPEYVVKASQIPSLLGELTAAELDGDWSGPSDLLSAEVALLGYVPGSSVPDRAHPDPDTAQIGSPTGLTCPECGGVLNRIEDGGPVRFGCRAGHTWSSQTLVAQQSAELESALWMALRSLEEKAALSHELAARATAAGRTRSGISFEEQSCDASRAATLVRDLLIRAAAGGVTLTRPIGPT
jgi:two-component system, chemotaxis family, protein-glutamate methylesterase/glutaminase